MGVKGVVQGRTKKVSSLRKKLEDLINAPDEGPSRSPERDAGNSIGRPANRVFTRAAKTASARVSNVSPEEHSKKSIGTVPNFKDWIDERREIVHHPEMGDLSGVRIGLYFPSDIPKVAKMIEAVFKKEWLYGTVTGGRDPTNGRNLDVDMHLNGPLNPGPAEYWEHHGYKSWQVVIERTHHDLKVSRVEIQVGTVVAKAWAEVQHNIIYKRSALILATPSMKRIIDAINGLAITTEIMLKESERALENAEEEADLQPFKNAAEFFDWYELTYLNGLRSDALQGRREAQDRHAPILLIRKYESNRWGPTACRKKFRELFAQQGVIQGAALGEKAFTLDITTMLWPRPIEHGSMGVKRGLW